VFGAFEDENESVPASDIGKLHRRRWSLQTSAGQQLAQGFSFIALFALN
jgi:hypothetical protein